MIVIKGIGSRDQCFSDLSFHARKCGLDDSQEDDFYDSLTSAVRMLGEKEIAVIAGGFNGHAEMQKPMRTSMEGMVVELGTRKGK